MNITRLWLSALVLALLLAGCAAPAAVEPAAATLTPTAAAAAAENAAAFSVETATALPEPTDTPVPIEPAEEPSTLADAPAAAMRYVIVPESSAARYRVTEQLANISLPVEAVGVTGDVTGEIVLNADGTIDSTASRFAVALGSLQSDRSQRDNYLRRSVLQTGQYPEATFIPRVVSGLPLPLPESGPVSFQITGDLTIRDVTREVTWEVSGTVDGSRASGQAATAFTFDDFNLTQPRVPIVLSIEDNIRLEVDLTLERVEN
ncbi:MAG: YceI family protein [Chloroflexi bacterium]|nr:YceI family protein [Chloroflexota bacterium]